MQHCNEIQVIPILRSFVNLSLTVFSRNWPCVALKRFDMLSVPSESSQHRPARQGAANASRAGFVEGCPAVGPNDPSERAGLGHSDHLETCLQHLHCENLRVGCLAVPHTAG